MPWRGLTGQPTVPITILESFNALPACFLRATRRNRLRLDQPAFCAQRAETDYE